MNIFELLTEGTKLKREDAGFGLEQYHNDDILLHGGMRSGGSSGDRTRRKYVIYDLTDFDQEHAEESQVGYVELFTDDASNKIIGLVNIVIPPKNRKAGIGRTVINSLKQTVGGPLGIYDIKKSAVPFWRKMGTKFYKDINFKIPLKTTSKHTGPIYGII